MRRSGITGSRGNFIFNFLKNHLPFSTAAVMFYIPTSKYIGFWFFLVLISTYNSRSLVTQSCLTLCDLMDCNWAGSSAHGILQARILEWVVMPSFPGSSQPRDQTQVSRIAGRFLHHLSHQGSLWILEWVAYPFSRGCSRPNIWPYQSVKIVKV